MNIFETACSSFPEICELLKTREFKVGILILFVWGAISFISSLVKTAFNLIYQKKDKNSFKLILQNIAYAFTWQFGLIFNLIKKIVQGLFWVVYKLMRPIIIKVFKEELKNDTELKIEIANLVSRELGIDYFKKFFTFKKQPDGDHKFPYVLDLLNYSYIIEIQPQSIGYWRCGFKFSKHKKFPQDRYGVLFPLLHLLYWKDDNSPEDKLYVKYFDENTVSTTTQIIDSYKKEKIKFEISANYDAIQVTILNEADIQVFNQIIIGYYHCQFLCWWDKNPNVVINTVVNQCV